MGVKLGGQKVTNFGVNDCFLDTYCHARWTFLQKSRGGCGVALLLPLLMVSAARKGAALKDKLNNKIKNIGD